jgi:hypothetical protein
MRHTANFHPEWGYLAPVPSFTRTARIVVVATAVGAIVGAGAGFSWVNEQATEPSVAARTLVRPIEAVSAGANTPAQATQANAPSSTDKRSLTVNSRSADGATNEPSASSKARVPEGMSIVAETPPATDEAAATAIAAPAPATKEPVPNVAPIKKKATKRSNVTRRFALRDDPLGLAPGGYYKRRSWGGYYGQSSGRGYQNWW